MRGYIKRQDGNVLFIILIAVALFAALSYAVTSSTRVGENSAKSESDQIYVSQVLQACSTLRQSAQRFLMGSQVTEATLQVNAGGGDIWTPCRTGAQCLFSAEGGQTIVPIPPLLKGGKGALPPVPMEYEFYGISDGVYLPGYRSNKVLVMFMAQNLSYDVCKKVNKTLGLPEEPPAENVLNPLYRDECVNATSIFTFRCPLTP